LVVLVFLVFSIYATMSRTAILALAAAVGLCAMAWLAAGRSSKQSVDPPVAKVTAAFIALIPLVVGMVLVYRSDVSAFSNRGGMWALGLDAVSGYELAGHGLDWWKVLAASGYFGMGFDHGEHSEYLLIYFSGGIVALALFALVLYRLTYIAIAEQNSLIRGAVVPLTFAVCGITETIWNPLSVDQGTWLFYALIAMCVPALYPTTTYRGLPPPKVDAPTKKPAI
jgi:hypothetical protein